MSHFTGAPLYALLPDPSWKTGDPFTFGDEPAPAVADPPEDPAEHDRAFAPRDLTEELALLHLWAHETVPTAACACAPDRLCLRCRVQQLLCR